MKFNDVMLPEWVGVLGSAVIVAVITAVAMPASSDELGYASAEQAPVESSSTTPTPTRRDESQP
jgi:hypothetical protein